MIGPALREDVGIRPALAIINSMGFGLGISGYPWYQTKKVYSSPWKITILVGESAISMGHFQYQTVTSPEGIEGIMCIFNVFSHLYNGDLSDLPIKAGDFPSFCVSFPGIQGVSMASMTQVTLRSGPLDGWRLLRPRRWRPGTRAQRWFDGCLWLRRGAIDGKMVG